jgi:hypothetical protein
MDLIARFAPLIAEIGAQMLGTPCAIEARLAKDQESSSFRPSQREATSPASGPKAPLPTPSSPNEKNDEGQVPSVQSAGQESKSSPLAAASFEGTAPDEATENADESENAVYVESSRHAVSSGPQNLTEPETRAIELIRKMFKGKVIATYTAPGASPSESLAPQYPSSSSADTPEYPEDTEAFEGGDEDDFDGY